VPNSGSPRREKVTGSCCSPLMRSMIRIVEREVSVTLTGAGMGGADSKKRSLAFHEGVFFCLQTGSRG
jgi:hypothetical protein